jgi:hypothetical protein
LANCSGGATRKTNRPRGTATIVRIPEGEPFSEGETRTIEWTLPRTVSELMGLAGTYSRFITMTRREQENAAHRAARVAAGRPGQGDRANVELPMRASAGRQQDVTDGFYDANAAP